jgi:lambda family phage tail tape measure protein
LSEQDKVAIAFAGAGRASGASVSGINAAANAGASIGGLSVASARELATALATTGKVANENFLPIVKLGRDFATTFGVSDVDAAKQLASAFSDPVRGAEQLNDRLGFLDAGMQRQIASLVAQNRLYDAQKVLLDGVQGSLARTAEVTGAWSQIWTGLKNTSSNAFNAIGQGIANVLHLNDSLEEQRAASQKRLDSYGSALGKIFGSSADYENEKRNLAEINALIEKRAIATQSAAAAQASLRVQQTIMAQLPEIGARQALADAAAIGGAAAEDPILMQKLGLTQSQVDRARVILQQLKQDFRTTFEEIQANSKIASDAVTAFSPSAKAAIAQRQATEQYRAAGGLDPSEKARIGQDAYNLSIKQTVTALSEAARARALSGNQAVDSARLEIDLLGKTIGQQAELRADLQSRQQLEQEASQNRTGFDNAQFERLKKINAELGRQSQLAAVAAVNDNIKFGRNTAFLSPDDIQIAQQLKGLYPDVAEALNSVQASGLRANQALSGLSSSVSGNLTTGISDAIDGTKSLGSAFTDTSKLVVRALEEMLVKLLIVGPAMRAIQGLFGGFLGGVGTGGGAATSTGAAGVGGIGGLYANGGAFGNVVPFASGGAFTNKLFNSPTLFRFANGGSMAAGVMGESGPEAVMPLRRGADGWLGVSAAGGGSSSGAGFGDIHFNGGIQINVPEGTSADDAGAIGRAVRDSMTQVVDERIYITRVNAGGWRHNAHRPVISPRTSARRLKVMPRAPSATLLLLAGVELRV